MAKSVLGKCNLCNRENVELKSSHYLPNWGYKAIQKSPEGGRQKRLIRVDRNKIYYPKQQIRSYLLCEKCEIAFSSREKWARQYSHAGDLPIIDNHEEVTRISGATLCLFPQNVDIEALKYFALSVYWRFSVTGDNKTLQLGPYEERLRKYLLNGRGELNSIYLFMYLIDDTGSIPSDKMMLIPKAIKRNNPSHWVHVFQIIGLRFHMLIGKKLPENLKNTIPSFDLIRNGNSFLKVSSREDALLETLVNESMNVPLTKNVLRDFPEN
ncbi:hypothetical protein [Reinekea marinisedimentorum]|uniref:Uncharacterized protein n=1 Tax=Reinekea marinisedimentorum TaxID=230495 RepID=A0A4R3I8D0_9GAMM|nr:hypothetical protein [Reinekea marinisedimentorum]TCS42513.1 hypothetical protein BCF53_103174 [Reinekea marinisedimentorum]